MATPFVVVTLFNQDFFTLFEYEVPLLKVFRKSETHLVGVPRGVIPVFRGDQIGVTVLREYVIRLQFVDEDQRLVDMGIMLGGRKEQVISMLIEQQINKTLDWKFASALSSLLVVATLIIGGTGIILFKYITKKRKAI